MSWLSHATGVHWNLRPLAAPAGALVGGLLGGPLGAGLGAGLMKSGDDLAHGDSLGHALGQGAINGALAYGTAGLFGGGGGSAAGQLAGDADPAFASSVPNSALGLSGSPVQQSVLRRVLGNTGSFIKDNRGTLETVGQGAQGVLSAVGQNRQANIEQQRANAEAAQIQAAIDKQKAVAAAFGQMYARGLPAPGAPALPSGGHPGASHSLMPSGGRMNGLSGVGPVTGDPGSDPSDPSDPNTPGGFMPKPPDELPTGGVPSNPTKQSILARLGYMPPPSSPYAGNESFYGTPYGSGYTQIRGY